jgi:hypothetical protein
VTWSRRYSCRVDGNRAPAGWLLSAVAVAAVVLAGCGGSSARRETATQISVPAYGVFPATTVTGSATTTAGLRACRSTARTFAEDAVDFLAHFGPAAAYPADLNFVIIREDLSRFASRGCDVALIGSALARRMTAAERKELVADLPAAMARVVRAGLARAGRELG